MKKLLFIYLISVLSVSAQVRKLEPISGHYKHLAALSSKSKPDTADRQQFALDGLSPKSSLRLKLKPQYLVTPVNDLIIKDFPANSSGQTKAEIEFLLGLEKTRTPEEVENCKFLATVFYNVNTKPGDDDYIKMQQNLFHMGRQIEGFNAQNLPKTAEMMRKVWTDGTYYFWALKFKYNRTRPYTLDKRMKPVDTGTNFMAYPSGHASASYIAAFVYQELLPKKKELFQKNAYEMGYSREIIGVHFPSDTESGRVFARQLVNLLLQNETFKKDFEAAKAEIDSKF